MPHVDDEIASQPACWRQAAVAAANAAAVLPQPSERVAVAGCGTSWHMATAVAALRESAGHGETDAFPASEMPRHRSYDRLLVITRSGTTSEVIDLLEAMGGRQPCVAVTADAGSPVVDAADDVVLLDFAEERSVVQTRFATSALVLLRAHLGHDIERLAAEADDALRAPLPTRAAASEQLTFLGRGWTVGLAQEAALKLREASLSWAEAYPAMEYRHGPISIADERSLVWLLGDAPPGLADDVARTGAVWEQSARDPLAELVRVQRLAVERARTRGLDPDRPRSLTRSVILDRG
jgi:fructoselysine-6-P-deglycase FrlB-like protein